MFVNRDWSRTEKDDFILNIQPRLRDGKEAVSQYYNNSIIGWVIQHRYE